MARISTYVQDTSINDRDRLIGTDGGQLGTDGNVIAGTAGATKNFSLSALRDFFSGVTGTTTIGTIPIQLADGLLGDSSITQNADGDVLITNNDLVVTNDIRLAGDLLNMAGEPIIDPDGNIMGENLLTYNTSTSANGAVTVIDIAPFTVHVSTRARMLRLPQNPEDGTWVKIVQLNRTGFNMLLGASRVMNTTVASSFILNDRTASFEMVYVAGAAEDGSLPIGWVIVGAN